MIGMNEDAVLTSALGRWGSMNTIDDMRMYGIIADSLHCFPSPNAMRYGSILNTISSESACIGVMISTGNRSMSLVFHPVSLILVASCLISENTIYTATESMEMDRNRFFLKGTSISMIFFRGLCIIGSDSRNRKRKRIMKGPFTMM